MKDRSLTVKKAHVHNLRGVDIKLSPNKLYVFTGVSGSGKSSLAFDTLYVEGQRRYVESLSAFARKYLGELSKPDIESADNLSPTISIEQKTAGRNPRSTVGTMTEIYDYLRVLYARVATPFCPISQEPVSSQSKERIIASIQTLKEGSKVILLAPFAKSKKGEFLQEFQLLQRKGFTKVRVDKQILSLDSEIILDGSLSHTIDVVIDRLLISKDEASRVADSVTTALEIGSGLCSIIESHTNQETLFSQHAYSPSSGKSYEALEPHDFSFNSPHGMCTNCLGLGYIDNDDTLTCRSCKGSRLKSFPSSARLSGKKIQEITHMTIKEALDFFEHLKLTDDEQLIGLELIKEIKVRLGFILDVGLHYLTLDRTAPTLSGGEAQRIRLASQIGSGLVGVTYILDEPSIGLHPRDNMRLISTLKRLRDKGNTVIVVEHDEETILMADEVVDFGPGPGILGGTIVFQGSVEGLLDCRESITGQYLSGKKCIPIPKKRRKAQGEFVEIKGAYQNNLKNIDVKIPLGLFIAITGVSGSGKSSLIFDILYPFLANKLQKASLHVGKHKEIIGDNYLDKVICIDQKPIGRTPRSNPATYIKLFDDIRALFCQLPESLSRGFLPGRFSFNVKEGSCLECSGMGMVKVDMDFMEDCWIPCNLCEGKRFDEETLSITYKSKSIADILDLSIDEALLFFDAIPTIKKKLSVLSKVGLGYMKVGQPSPTLSGGEAQRIKLAKELVRPSTGKTLYLFDEPTTGLHFSDTHNLLNVMQELVDRGNTLIVIEHNMDVVKVSDWIIDLGPEGGNEGGQIIACNTPELIAKMDTPTGKELKVFLDKSFTIPKDKKNKKDNFSDQIKIEDAEQHNLKRVSLEIPREKITICTGPSGSGKSSLAFDTLYAEGQRRYTESLSAYARQFVEQMPKPKVGSIEGLSPSIAIEQKANAGNPRSTVGTLTEIYDFLRVLYARLAIAYCPESGEEIRSISKEFVVDKLMNIAPSTPIYIMAPMDVPRQETFEAFQDKLLKKGFIRIYLNNQFYELDSLIPYERGKKNKLFLVVDRLKIAKDIRKRLYEAVECAASISKGTLAVLIDKEDKREELFFNLSFAVVSTGKSYPPLTPKSFAFNTEDGMCPDCQGLGTQWGADLVKFKELSSLTIKGLLTLILYNVALNEFKPFFNQENIDIDTQIEDLTDREMQLVMNGSTKTYISSKGYRFKWVGINSLLATVGHKGRHPAKYIARRWLDEITCPSCQGSRLNPLSSKAELNGLTIGKLTAMPINEASHFIDSIKIPKNLQKILEEVMRQLSNRFKFLQEVGLDYIALNRTAPTLSNGEAQRIRLARQLGSGLTGVLYVLDEPTVGLHPKEVDMLNAALKKLNNLGNTLVIVEHDPQTMPLADYIIDMGPKSGKYGGHIVSRGTLKEIKKDENSLTGSYLSKKLSIPLPEKRRKAAKDFLEIKNASKHNLKNIHAKFPIGRLTVVSGASGSGKSTLMHSVIKPLVQTGLLHEDSVTSDCGQALGINFFDKLIIIDQNPIGQTIRSDVATYVELLTPLREFLAKLPKAQALGLMPKHFSYNLKAGMCMSCYGLGHKKIEMQFLPPVIITCPECRGARLNKKSLQINYLGKNFGDILKLTVDEALEFFDYHPKMKRILTTLQSVGLGYVTLGQEVQTLSGGEAQRIKLSYELSKRSQGKTLYLIDEPTTGLHSDDLAKLLVVMQKLVDLGNTMIVIEHNLDVIKCADYIIDLGPQSGQKGGYIIAEGTPEELIKNPQSITGPYLKQVL
jgi:excinuclease ABC subunit A